MTMDQIIPTKDAEEYMIGMAEKTQNDIDKKAELKNRHIVRKEFWGKLIEEMNKKSDLFQNISPVSTIGLVRVLDLLGCHSILWFQKNMGGLNSILIKATRKKIRKSSRSFKDCRKKSKKNSMEI